MASERFKRAVEKQNKEREERDLRIWKGIATEEEKAAQKRESTYTGYTTGGYWKGSKKKTNQEEKTGVKNEKKQIPTYTSYSKSNATQDTKERLLEQKKAKERNQKRLENARKQREGYGTTTRLENLNKR